MSVTGSAKLFKYILVTLNCFVVLTGGASVVLGVWSLTSKYGSSKISDLTNIPLYRGLSISAIVGGWFIFVNAFLGCYGSLMENKPLLVIYFIVMLLLLLILVVTATLVFVYRDDLKVKMSSELENTLINNYGANVKYADITHVWDEMQRDLRCCGVEGNVSSSRSWFLWQSSNWFHERKQGDGFLFVPESCCNRIYTLRECQLLNMFNWKQPIQTKYTQVVEDNPALYSTGCLDKIINGIMSNIGVIAGVLVGILAVLSISMVISLALFRRIISAKWNL